MKEPTITAVCMGLVSCLLCTVVAAQEERHVGDDVVEGVVYDEHRGIERPYMRLKGDALPTYVVVEAFFHLASGILDRSTEIWNAFLGTLDIQPGSASESAFREAILEARDSVLMSSAGAHASATTRDPPPSDWEDHVDLKREQVKSLAQLYASMLTDLSSSGYPLDKLYLYLRTEVRPGMSYTMYPDPESSVNLEAILLDEVRKFDDSLTTALAAEDARRGEGGE